MTAVPTFYRTTIGKKVLMAISGAIGYLFVIAHMVGNWHVFEGPAEFNAYAEFLRTVGMPAVPYGGLLWIVRIVLTVAVVVHVWMAIDLSRRDLASRPVRYARKQRVSASFASVTLRYGGVAIFLFILFHLAQLTWGWVTPFQHGDAYNNVLNAFRNPILALLYVLAMAALGMHLYHGVWSMFQTLGLNSQRTNGWWRGLAILSGIGLFLGFSIVPLAVMFRIVS